jgi:signal transduction histidine kinase
MLLLKGVDSKEKQVFETEEPLTNYSKDGPFPVIYISGNGQVLCCNSSAESLISDWDCKEGAIVPQDWKNLIETALNSCENQRHRVSFGDNMISFVITPIVRRNYVIVYGIDVTEQWKVEEELLRLNVELERGIEKSTHRLVNAQRKLHSENVKRKKLEKDLLQISEREKRLVGQELHDSVGQIFAGLAFMAQLLKQQLHEIMPNEAGHAAEIAKLANKAMDMVRAFAKGLHPIDLKEGDLAEALRELAATTSLLFEIHCEIDCPERFSFTDNSAAIHVYRIAQEAVTNAIKHGHAKNISIHLTCCDGTGELIVKNDGKAFPNQVPCDHGLGLGIMRHRAELIGAKLSIMADGDNGTILNCTFET